MNAEFNWWLLIVGLVLGAALTWLVMAESTRRDADVSDAEQRGEALWIASVLSSAGRPTESSRVEEILRLHRDYLAAPPPDEPGAADAEPPVPPVTVGVDGPIGGATADTPASSEVAEAPDVPEGPEAAPMPTEDRT